MQNFKIFFWEKFRYKITLFRANKPRLNTFFQANKSNLVTLFPTNHPYYTTFFQANHSINYRNQLYFISVFIYTFIKVKLTKGRKRDSFAQTKPNQTYRLSLLAAKYEQSKYEDWAKYNSKQSNTHLLPGHKKTTRKSVNLSSILQPEPAK